MMSGLRVFIKSLIWYLNPFRPTPLIFRLESSSVHYYFKHIVLTNFHKLVLGLLVFIDFKSDKTSIIKGWDKPTYESFEYPWSITLLMEFFHYLQRSCYCAFWHLITHASVIVSKCTTWYALVVNIWRKTKT